MSPLISSPTVSLPHIHCCSHMGSLLSFCTELTGLRPFVLLVPLPVMFVSESLDGQPFHAFQSSFRGHLWPLCLKSQHLFLPHPLPQTSYPHSLPFFIIFSFNCHLICCMLKNFYSICGVSSTDNFCISPKLCDFYLFFSIHYILSFSRFSESVNALHFPLIC